MTALHAQAWRGRSAGAPERSTLQRLSRRWGALPGHAPCAATCGGLGVRPGCSQISATVLQRHSAPCCPRARPCRAPAPRRGFGLPLGCPGSRLRVAGRDSKGSILAVVMLAPRGGRSGGRWQRRPCFCQVGRCAPGWRAAERCRWRVGHLRACDTLCGGSAYCCNDSCAPEQLSVRCCHGVALRRACWVCY